MIYGSVCSGIEAASVAWHPLGWRASFLSEIDAFPRAVLAHHYPDVPLHGDFTTIEAGQYAAIDVLVGGTPCQSFSVAGLRKGLADERGNLALEFCLLARRLRPRWVVWENVPGVLSLEGGRAFASILGGLAECGYGLAYRVLDAQFVRIDGFGRAVPQRRRRVFVVGHLGDWRRAAAVLFERQSLSWDSPPSRKAGQGIAGTITSRTGSGVGADENHARDGHLVAFGGNNQTGPIDVATAQNAHGGAGRMDFETETFVAHALRADGFDAGEDGTERGTPLVPVAIPIQEVNKRTGVSSTDLRAGDGIGDVGDPMYTLGTDSRHGVAFAINSHAGAADGDQTNRSHASGGPVGLGIQEGVAYSLRAGRTQSVAAPICFDETQITSKANRSQPQAGETDHPLAAGARPPTIAFSAKDHGADAMNDLSPTLRAGGFDKSHANAGVMPAIAFRSDDYESGSFAETDRADPLTTSADRSRAAPLALSLWRVRRLTPTECARLQGFPDDYLDIIYRGKPAADGPKYKALGNSFAVNVVRWIGRRIEMVEKIK